MIAFIQQTNKREDDRRAAFRAGRRTGQVIALGAGVLLGVVLTLTGFAENGPAWTPIPLFGFVFWGGYAAFSGGLFGTSEDKGSDIRRQAKKLIMECGDCGTALNLSIFQCGSCTGHNQTYPSKLVSPFTGCTRPRCDHPQQAGFQCSECGSVHVLDEGRFRKRTRFGDHGNGVAQVHRHITGDEMIGGLFGFAMEAVDVLHPGGLEGAAKDIAEEFDKERHDFIDRTKARMQARRDRLWDKAGVQRPIDSAPDEDPDLKEFFRKSGFGK